jgi:hypothetical protein
VKEKTLILTDAPGEVLQARLPVKEEAVILTDRFGGKTVTN